MRKLTTNMDDDNMVIEASDNRNGLWAVYSDPAGSIGSSAGSIRISSRWRWPIRCPSSSRSCAPAFC